jgi:hypothetical protein
MNVSIPGLLLGRRAATDAGVDDAEHLEEWKNWIGEPDPVRDV